jgi:hypothetical protein
MAACRILCCLDGCGRLVRNITPVFDQHLPADFDTNKYCSSRCAGQSLVETITCRNDNCYRMIAHETQNSTTEPPRFDVQKYCSVACARTHYRRWPLEASVPIVTCNVCADDKSFTSFVHMIQPRGFDAWGYPIMRPGIPPQCRYHIMPELMDFESGVCVDCISAFLETRLKTRGAGGITCVSETCAPYIDDDLDDPDYTSWLAYAPSFLAETLHPEFFQGAFELWLSRRTKWECPNGCATADYVFEPAKTPGYPQVHCPGCEQRYCAQCKALWHDKKTCQQYRAEHPDMRDETEVQTLADMAKVGAKRCPCCQSLIIKDGGCDHMLCEACGSNFSWMMAERVVPIKGSDDEESTTSIDKGEEGEDEDYDEDYEDYDEDFDVFQVPTVPCELDYIAMERMMTAQAAAANPV